VIACVTGATGFLGAHVCGLLAEKGWEVRATYRSPSRLERLADLPVESVKADVMDRAAMRRAVRGSDVVFHTAGYVSSTPAHRVWDVNALAPRIAIEAAAAEDVRRVVLTSTVGAIGRAEPGEVADERSVYMHDGPGLTYSDAKHEGEAEALAAGARLGVEVVVVNPAYVLGVPVNRSQPGETSTRTVGHYLRGRLPAVVDGDTNLVDVRDVASGHLLAAERGKQGERYVLGGYNLRWVDFIDRVASISGVSHPLIVLPTEVATAARVQLELGLPSPLAPDAFVMMAQHWRYSSRKARSELGYRTRPLDETLRETVAWYQDLIEKGAFRGGRPSPLSLAAFGVRAVERLGVGRALKLVEPRIGRRLVAGA
jgi:dihydroflavonol-4-reductase